MRTLFRLIVPVSMVAVALVACSGKSPSSSSGAGAGSSGGSGSASGTGAGSGTTGNGTGGGAPAGAPWAGIVDATRAIDWSGAGVVGGIPTRTTACSTLQPGATAKQINAAIQACPTGQVVMLAAGNYAISDDGIVMKSGVTLRGAGADQTLLVFTAVNYCSNLGAAICFEGSNDWAGGANVQPGGANAADWTGGYAQGATQITLTNVGSSGIVAGQYIYLDQANDAQVGPDFFVCDSAAASCSLEGGNGGRTINGVLHSQAQIVQVTAVNGSTVTITPPLYSPNWRASQSPGAWWPTQTTENAGLEDLSVDASNSGGQMNVVMYNSMNDWVRGVRLVRDCTCERSLLQLAMAAHCTIESNYVYGTQGQSVNYGIEAYGASDNLIQNNILQHVVSPMMVQPALGSVYAYNYAINDTYYGNDNLDWLSAELSQHNAGVEYQLYEGNVGPAFGADVFHGNQLANTLFRNYFLGTDPGRIGNTTSINLMSYVRYMNVVGNVLGTPGSTTVYEDHANVSAVNTVYNLGGGDSEGSVTVAPDPLVATTLLRWGNYDTANGVARFEASEVPSGITPYGNAVPKTQSLPPSFYLGGKPGFWPAAKAWPAIGPDVSGGNVAGLDGHANTLPAEDCFHATMGGPADGSGPVLSFNASTCYGAP